MDDEEDDLYGSAPAANGQHDHVGGMNGNGTIKAEEQNGMDGEEEEEDEDDDSDIDIITERKDGPAAPTQDFKQIKREPVRISSAAEPQSQRASQPASIKQEAPTVQGGKLNVRDGSKYPQYRSSNIDINNIPMYDPAGKPITEIDLDADVAMETKPWRVPGTDPTDFFNYGFDEFTWVQYCMKQNQMKDTVSGLKNETKQFEAMLSGGPQQGMPPMSGMPGMPDMNPEMMNAMFSQMQAQGISDPSQLDFNAFMGQMQQMGGMPGMPGMPGGFGGQNMQHQNSNPGFGGQQHGQSPFQGNQGYGGGTPQAQQQGQGQQFDGYSAQQMAMMQQQQGTQGGGRGRGRGRRW